MIPTRAGFIALVSPQHQLEGEVPEWALRGECPFDCRDDVQEREYSADFEDLLDDRRSPQHDRELAIKFAACSLASISTGSLTSR